MLEQLKTPLNRVEAQYWPLLEQLPVITYITSLDDASTSLYISSQIEPVLGFSVAEWLAGSALWIQQLHPDDRERVLEMSAHALATGEAFQAEYRVRGRDGRSVWFRDESVVVKDETGQPLFNQGILFDITSQKQAEEKLKYQANLVENVSDAIISTDLSFHIQSWNKAAEIIYGWSADEVIGKILNEIIPATLSVDKVALIFEQFKQAGHWQGEVIQWHKNGQPIHIHNSATLLRDSAGQPAGIVAINRDITQRKQVENLLAGQKEILEMITRGFPLADTLNTIIQLIETQAKGMLCSILLLDKNGVNLRHGAAPSLPASYCQAIDGDAIGPAVGSCGTAAFLGKAVIVVDIATDPLWADYRDLALLHGLRACWSTPIFSTNHEVLGTFAMYYHEPRSPTSNDFQLIEAATGMASIAIEHQQIEQSLRDSEAQATKARAQFIDAIDSLTEGFALYDAEDRLVLYNSKYKEFYNLVADLITPGVHLEELIKMSAYQGQIMEAIGREEDWIKERMAHQRNPKDVYLQQLGDGRWLQITDRKTKDGGVVGVRTDITERIQAEKALREGEERFRATFEQAAVGLAHVGLDHRWLRVNQKLCDIVGYSREELLGRTTYDLTYHEDLKLDPDYTQQILRGEIQTHSREKRYVHKNGSVIWVNRTMSVARDAHGEPKYSIAVIEDITERKHLEEQLRQAQKLEAIGRLAGGVAHDFNNLLTVINGYSDLLLHHFNDHDPSRRDIEQIRKAGERAASLTRQLLAFSRQQVLQPQILDLNLVMTDMEKMLRRLIGEHIELITFPRPGLGWIKADLGQLEQVIMNLAVNARDAMPQGGKLTLETANVILDQDYTRQHVNVAPGSYVMLTVSDTGSGMAAGTITHIFEPFFTTKEVGKGTGLGLATVYGIVAQSDGHLQVSSEVGRGTSFHIYFPQVREPSELSEPKDNPVELQRGHETILLVEDEASVRVFIRDILKQNGYTVLEAGHGQEALAISQEHSAPIHLLLTDVVMPHMSGRELTERLLLARPELKLLYISGYTDDASLHHAIQGLGTAFLQKPFTPDILAGKIREILDAK